jgi:hypothetical protein
VGVGPAAITLLTLRYREQGQEDQQDRQDIVNG